MPKGQKDPSKPKLPDGLRLPNEGSELQTPTTLQVDLHYAGLRVWERWSWDRFVRLCKFLNLTPAELASIACIPHNQLNLFQQRNRIMQSHAPNRAAALLLTILEAHCTKAFTNDVIESPFPDLSQPDKT